jgi:hypothetical protein
MHESFRRRLESLEQAHGLRSPAPHIVSIMFPGMEMTVAESNGFIAYRRADEELLAFADRAERELMAANPHPRMPQILIFKTSEARDVSQC